MKANRLRIAALVLSVALLFSLAGCNKTPSESGAGGTKEPVYSFTNTLKEPPNNFTEEVEAPSLTGDTGEMQTTVNPEIIGWLQVPGTDINEPVVQTTNNSKYLRRDYAGKYDFQGSYFMDYESRSGVRSALSRHLIIYGHNTAMVQDDPNGLDFAQLLRFEDPEFAATHPYVFYSSTEEDMVWEIFAVFYTDLKFKYVEMINNQIDTLVNEAKARSVLTYSVQVDAANDTILTLSTCTAKYGYVNGDSRARFCVMARLVPAGAELKSTVGVEKNTSVKAPQL